MSDESKIPNHSLPHMKTKPLLFFVFAAAVAGYLWFGSKSASSGSSELVKIAYQPIVFGMPVFVAEQDGLFAKHGVTAETKSFTSANDMINALVAGDVVMVPGAPLVPVLSLESKYPGKFRIFAHSVMTNDKPFDRILVKNESAIKAPGDLAGKRLALIPGTTAMNAMKAYLKKNGVGVDQVEFVQLAPPAQMPALEAGSVDALYAYEPTLTVALSKGTSYRAITPSVYCSMIEPCPLVVSIISREFERKHPKEAKAGIEAIQEAIKLMKADPNKASAALVPYTKIAPELAGKVSIQQMTQVGEINTANLQQFIDILVQIGELQATISAHQLLNPE